MRRAADGALSNVVPTQGDATALPYADDSVDAVVLTAVLGEIPDQEAALAEIERVLKPGGGSSSASCSATPTSRRRARCAEPARRPACASSAAADRRSGTSQGSPRELRVEHRAHAATATRRLLRARDPADPPRPRLLLRGRRRDPSRGPRDPGANRRPDDSAGLARRLDLPRRNGHIQATGFDDAGRKQYLYHLAWRERRDREKFAEMEKFAKALPRMRERTDEDLDRRGLVRDRVLACAVRLLDLGFFRIGSERYAEENETYGLATLRLKHVKIERGVAVFDYTAKNANRHRQEIADPAVVPTIKALAKRRGGGLRPTRLPRRPRVARRQGPRDQPIPEGGDGRRLQRQGLPDLERDRPHRGRAGDQRPRAPRRRRRASTSPPPPPSESPSTSPTRRRSAAPPTSTRASSTATTPARRSARR